MNAETATFPQTTLQRQQRAFDDFRHSYNEERPHESPATPASRLYRSLFRHYPSRVSISHYEPGVTVRRLHTNGQIKWKGDTIYISGTLRNEPIGLVSQNDRF